MADIEQTLAEDDARGDGDTFVGHWDPATGKVRQIGGEVRAEPPAIPAPTAEDLARDAQLDLAVCEAATPGPWEVSVLANECELDNRPAYCREVGSPSSHLYAFGKNRNANILWAVMARTALPAWIRRAEAERRKRAESEADWEWVWKRLRDQITSLEAEREQLKAQVASLTAEVERCRDQAAGKATEACRLQLAYDRLLAERNRFQAALHQLACWYDGEIGPHMETPRVAAIAREALQGGEDRG